MTLDNAGLYYEGYYVHGSDVLAIDWLSEHDVNHAPIVADPLAVDRLLAYGGITASNENFPAVLPKNAFVYLRVSGDTVVSVGQFTLYYSSDKTFLDKYKNSIYNNGEVIIYK